MFERLTRVVFAKRLPTTTPTQTLFLMNFCFRTPTIPGLRIRFLAIGRKEMRRRSFDPSERVLGVSLYSTRKWSKRVDVSFRYHSKLAVAELGTRRPSAQTPQQTPGPRSARGVVIEHEFLYVDYDFRRPLSQDQK